MRSSLRPFAARVDVEAIVQEAALRLWQVAPRFVPDGRPNGMLRLLCRIARNLALDELRRRREVPLDPDGHTEPAAIEIEGVDPMLRRLVVDCFDKLPPKPALALGARLEAEGAEPDLVLCARLEMRLNTFLQNVTRARKLLAQCLEAQGVALPGGSSS